MAKENQRITITKRLLKESLLRLMKKKDIDHITITELCREAGINRATFYRHYELPRDVLLDMEMDLFYEIKERTQVPNSALDVKKYLDEMCAFLYDNAEMIGIFLDNNTDADFLNLLNELYTHILSEQADLYHLEQYDDDSIKLLTTYFAGGGYFLMRQWLKDEIHKTPQEISDLIWKIFQTANLPNE